LSRSARGGEEAARLAGPVAASDACAFDRCVVMRLVGPRRRRGPRGLRQKVFGDWDGPHQGIKAHNAVLGWAL